MKYLLLTIITVFTITQVNAQNYNFGKVSKAELEEKWHPTDSSASAAILYKKEHVNFFFDESRGFMQRREIQFRIKIYNKDGFDWATKKVYLYKGQKDESISGLKGFSYNLEGSKIKKDKLSSDGKFKEDYNDYLKINSFTMPNVKQGTVIEYKYTINSPRIGIDDFVLQYNIPINKLDVKVATPQYYIYNSQLNPRAKFIPKLNKTTQQVSVPFDYKIDMIDINEENVPALNAEAYAGNINNYRSGMSMELTAILNAQKVIEKTFSTNWEKVSKTIYDSQNFGGQLGRTSFYKDDLEALLAGANEDFEKAILVENLVKSKVKWNGNYSKYAQKGIRAAYKEGEGNVADINLMVVAMLRSQGVNANPVLISTRNNGIPLFPTREGFNYVICCVQSGDSYMLIDATEKYSTNNVLPQRVLNWRGRLIEAKGVSRWVDIKPNTKSVESTMLNIKINDDFNITGKVSKNLTDYIAYRYRKEYAQATPESHIKALEKDNGNLEISTIDFKNRKDIYKDVKVSYEYNLADAVDEIGDKLYFSPLLFMAMKENPFKLEERQYPIDFIIPYEDKYLINIMLPEGYVLESLPKSEAIAFNDNDVKFVYVAKANGSYLQLKVQLDINNPTVLPKDYKDFKAFFGKIVEKQGEQIVLNKAKP
ncbi:transglutaminase domain-containing protein [uncultured Winogradskyella sp.]|uniref:transglutaminase domain-containing protein n=1 Tax=uncultured Winogradskyella sp. TaxID=395353 RepID=UPI002635466C|nr:transglutaminase domain-containing protein [uncultured Winogradskyella sp.]